MLAGVCGGIGQYLGMDPTLVRVLYAVITFFTALIPGTILYIILAFVVPSDDAPAY
jgi:phage shock protein C